MDLSKFMKEKKEAHDRKRNAPPVDSGEGSSSGKKTKEHIMILTVVDKSI